MKSFFGTPPPSLFHAMLAANDHAIDNHVRGSPVSGAALVTGDSQGRADTG